MSRAAGHPVDVGRELKTELGRLLLAIDFLGLWPIGAAAWLIVARLGYVASPLALVALFLLYRLVTAASGLVALTYRPVWFFWAAFPVAWFFDWHGARGVIWVGAIAAAVGALVHVLLAHRLSGWSTGYIVEREGALVLATHDRSFPLSELPTGCAVGDPLTLRGVSIPEQADGPYRTGRAVGLAQGPLKLDGRRAVRRLLYRAFAMFVWAGASVAWAAS